MLDDFLRYFKFDKLEDKVLLVLAIMIILTLLMQYYKGWRRLHNNPNIGDRELKLIKRLALWYIFLGLIPYLVQFPYAFERILLGPLYIVMGTLTFFIYGIFFFRFYLKKREKDLVEIKTESDLTHYISKILDSEQFLTALRATLPKGNDDEKYGFNFIPFMLENIDQRRKRFKEDAKKFLFATILLGAIFTVFVIVAGYILLDEDSLGSPGMLTSLKRDVEKVNENLSIIFPHLAKLETNFNRNLDKVQKYDEKESLDKKNREIHNGLLDGISEYTKNRNLFLLVDLFGNASKTVVTQKGENAKFVNLINQTHLSLLNYGESKNESIHKLKPLILKIDDFLGKANDQIKATPNRTAEILKRFVLSIAILSFLFAILRFAANLYRTRYREMVVAEIEDLTIRKFYVAYKSSGQDKELLQTLLPPFMNSQYLDIFTKSSKDSSEQDFSIIKSVLETISKKI
jgi:hypothetical protein